MSLKSWLTEVRWNIVRRWFGIWGVQDYYTLLEQRAESGAQLTFGYLLLVIVATLLATMGLLINSPVVVIGSMCVAPFLSPSRAVCIGAIFGNKRAFIGGLFKQLVGLLIIGTGLAYLVTVALLATVPGVQITQEILLRGMPTTKDVVLSVLIATAAGVAASLALSADPRVVTTPWGQIIDAMIGVEIAISLIPPASVIGIGLAFLRLDIAENAFRLLMVNVLGLDILGSMPMLALRGVRPRYLAMEKAIRKATQSALAKRKALAGSDIAVALLNPTAAAVHVVAYSSDYGAIEGSVAQDLAEEIEATTGFRSSVTVDVIPRQMYSTLKEEIRGDEASPFHRPR